MKINVKIHSALTLWLAIPITAAIAWHFATFTPTNARDVIPWILSIVALLALTWLLRSRSWSDGIWHPLVGVGLYVSLVCFGPIIFLLVTNEPLWVMRPENIQNRTIIAMVLTVVGMLAGMSVGLIGLGSDDKSEAVGSRLEGIDEKLVATFGTLALAVATAGRLVAVALTWGTTYGADQIEVTALSFLWSGTQSLIFVAVILCCLGNMSLGRLLTRRQWIMLILFAVASLASGDRGFLIAPAVFLAFARHRWIRPLPLMRLAPLGILAIIVFVWVGEARLSNIESANQAISNPQGIVEGVLMHVSSPYLLTNDLVQRVPDQYGHTSGSTYLSALKRQIPGPISLRLFGQPEDTGAMVYREVMDIRNPNMGYSFAFPAEAYLNFGLQGNLLMGCGLGWVLGTAFRWNRVNLVSPKALLYPILLATLIVGFRTDALGHIKTVLYPMVIVTAVWISARRLPTRFSANGSDRVDHRRYKGVTSA